MSEPTAEALANAIRAYVGKHHVLAFNREHTPMDFEREVADIIRSHMRQPPAEDALAIARAFLPGGSKDPWIHRDEQSRIDRLAQRIEEYVQLRIDEYIEGALYAHDRKPLMARHEETQEQLGKLARGEGDDS